MKVNDLGKKIRKMPYTKLFGQAIGIFIELDSVRTRLVETLVPVEDTRKCVTLDEWLDLKELVATREASIARLKEQQANLEARMESLSFTARKLKLPEGVWFEHRGYKIGSIGRGLEVREQLQAFE